MRSIFAKSILLVSVLVAFVGCNSGKDLNPGNTGNSGGEGRGTQENADQFPRPGYPGTTPLTKHAWCADLHAHDGKTYTIRYKLDDGGKFYHNIWQLDVNSVAVAEHDKGEGRWDLQGAELTMFIEGNARTQTIRHDPGSGSPTLYIDQGNGKELAFKPCR